MMIDGENPTLRAKIGKRLIRDELFDLTLYRMYEKRTNHGLRDVLKDLARIEEGHYRFWQSFFKLEIANMGMSRRLKLWIILIVTTLLGEWAVRLTLEAIEIHGIKKYLALWEEYRDTEFGSAVRGILDEELKHEDEIVSRLITRAINPERIRTIFLGFNDGLVEILGAVSGFFAAFHDVVTVIIAGLTVAVAGTISMAAGVFVASSSEREIQLVTHAKVEALNGGAVHNTAGEFPLHLASVVGASYFIGALIPLAPLLFGAQSMVGPIAVAAIIIIIVSLVLAFLSGMDIRKRIAMNVVIIGAATGITFALSLAVKYFFEIQI